MLLVISPEGLVRGIYDEALDYGALGAVEIQRASRVDPDEMQAWWADLGIVNGPRLGPFPRRSLALEAERAWLEAHLVDLPLEEGNLETVP
jgi:hypothetical protein